jgi:hypothetical protein
VKFVVPASILLAFKLVWIKLVLNSIAGAKPLNLSRVLRNRERLFQSFLVLARSVAVQWRKIFHSSKHCVGGFNERDHHVHTITIILERVNPITNIVLFGAFPYSLAGRERTSTGRRGLLEASKKLCSN